jgi:membrane-associated phospholipid phosphatase
MLLFWVTRTSVAVVPLALSACLIVILAGLSVIYTRWRPDPIIGPMTGGLAALTWSGLIAAISALAALRTGAPFIDPSLARVDTIIGLSTPTFVSWVAPYSNITCILAFAYDSTVPMVFASVILLSLKRREIVMWELCFVFAATAPLCALLTAIAPAVGPFTYYSIRPDVLAMLPKGSGLYFLPILEAYHSRSLSIVDVRHLEGVVTFPSFHAIMALMTAYALRNMRALTFLAWTWSGIILISTIPIGGHYVIDIIGGAMVWAVITLSVRARVASHSGDADVRSADRTF